MIEHDFLRAHLPDQKWRLNHLYHIVNEDGDDVVFKMRPAQEALYDNLHYRNIILKARQEGFTTFIDLLALDCAIFTPNFSVEINAESLPKATDIFANKVVYPYEHLPVEIQRFCPIVSQTKDGTIEFGNGSSIQVDVSARSGTFQFMHISEYGVVSTKYPGKAEEIQTGSIPAVPKTGFIFIESTAKGAAGEFFKMCETARKDTLAGKKLSPLQFRFHFFPWHWHAEYRLDPASVDVPRRLLEYFDKLYDRYGITLDEQQQAWYASQEATLGEKMWSEYPSYPEEAFALAQEGAYYARQFTRIYSENRICKVLYDPILPVYTGWDLGISDDTSIWFLQFFGREIRVIDFYANSGEGLAHYASVIADTSPPTISTTVNLAPASPASISPAISASPLRPSPPTAISSAASKTSAKCSTTAISTRPTPPTVSSRWKVTAKSGTINLPASATDRCMTGPATPPTLSAPSLSPGKWEKSAPRSLPVPLPKPQANLKSPVPGGRSHECILFHRHQLSGLADR